MAKGYENDKGFVGKIVAVFVGPKVQQLRAAVLDQNDLVRAAKGTEKSARNLDKRYAKDRPAIDRITIKSESEKNTSNNTYMGNLGVYVRDDVGFRKNVRVAMKWNNTLLEQRENANSAATEARERVREGVGKVSEARTEMLSAAPRLGRLVPAVHRAGRLVKTSAKMLEKGP
ncbi:hypothetical protein [Yinghuangia sp. YIM S10712]|uniref:hypothetical protein n=1 Tax=Yinghuangia sp. YIM S10712 TaxID=3436930 RepID=UPI003F535151